MFDNMWVSPGIVMLQNTTSEKNQGSIVSIFFLATTMAGIFSTAFLGYIQGSLGGIGNPGIYGQTLAFANCIPTLLTVPLFYMAGKHYV
jgi:hypothetical protein